MLLRTRCIATLVGTSALAVACSQHPAPAAGAAGEGGPAASASAAPPAAAASASADAAAAVISEIPQADIDTVVNPDKIPPYTGPTGSVEGTVTVDGPPPPPVTVDTSRCPAALDTYGKLFREGDPVRPGGPRTLADAVVVVTGGNFFVPEKHDAVRVAIGPDCAYPTRTIALTFGQRLDVVNQTKLLFAPVIDIFEQAAMRVAPPLESGDPVHVYPRRAGLLKMTDGLEPFIHEDIEVLRHPFHAVTNRGGYYRIDGVPVGALKLGVYHPAAKAGAEVPVTIAAGQVARVDVKLTYKPPPPPGKYDPKKNPPIKND